MDSLSWIIYRENSGEWGEEKPTLALVVTPSLEQKSETKTAIIFFVDGHSHNTMIYDGEPLRFLFLPHLTKYTDVVHRKQIDK